MYFIVVIATLSAIIGGQWLLIWRLLDRILVLSHVPSLGPVRTTPPDDPPAVRVESHGVIA